MRPIKEKQNAIDKGKTQDGTGSMMVNYQSDVMTERNWLKRLSTQCMFHFCIPASIMDEDAIAKLNDELLHVLVHVQAEYIHFPKYLR